MLDKEEPTEKYNIKISFKEKKIFVLYKSFQFQFDENGKLVETCKEEFLKFIFEVNKEAEIEVEKADLNDDDAIISFKLDKVKEWLENFLRGLND